MAQTSLPMTPNDVEHDSEGRITRAADDTGRWVKYEYDERGVLARAVNWRGETQQFRYDDHFNMLFVR